jgi:hypothetical protein
VPFTTEGPDNEPEGRDEMDPVTAELVRETNPPSRAPLVWAGGLLLLAGVCLVLLGGCFLLGALALLRPDVLQPGSQPVQLSGEAAFLLHALEVAGLGCLLLAAALLLLGIRSLLRVPSE